MADLRLQVGGDAVTLSLYGGQVLSWQCRGRERLFLSEKALLNGTGPIRGGVPVCFPQFNQRGPLPKHGLVRQSVWQPVGQAQPWLEPEQPDGVQQTLAWHPTPAQQALWPVQAQVTLQVALRPDELRVTLQVSVPPTATAPAVFTGALHTYLAVDDVAQVALQGLGGQPEWDALTDVHGHAADELRFADAAPHQGFDRVYTAAPQPLRLVEGAHTLELSQSPQWPQTVVWNPGALACAQLADMTADGYRRMLCVEAAAVDTAQTVQPGQVWQGWQRLRVCAPV